MSDKISISLNNRMGKRVIKEVLEHLDKGERVKLIYRNGTIGEKYLGKVINHKNFTFWGLSK